MSGLWKLRNKVERNNKGKGIRKWANVQLCGLAQRREEEKSKINSDNVTSEKIVTIQVFFFQKQPLTFFFQKNVKYIAYKKTIRIFAPQKMT